MLPIVSKAIVAELTFLSLEEGGRRTPPSNPAGGHVKIADDLFVTSTIAAIDETNTILADPERFKFGKSYRVMVLPLLPHESDLKLTSLEVFEGPRLTARGSVHAIIEVNLRAIHQALDDFKATKSIIQ